MVLCKLFPFLFGWTFIEARCSAIISLSATVVPFLLGRAFIKASPRRLPRNLKRLFPSACGDFQ